MTQYFFKIIDNDGTGGFSIYRWPLGRWTKRINGPLIPCSRGYHVLRPRDINKWIRSIVYNHGYKIYLVKVETENMQCCYDKVVVRRARTIRQMKMYWGIVWWDKYSVANWMKLNGINLI